MGGNLAENVCVFCKMWNPNMFCNQTRSCFWLPLWLVKKSAGGWNAAAYGMAAFMTTMQISVKWNHNLRTTAGYNQPTYVTQRFTFREIQHTFHFLLCTMHIFKCVSCLVTEQCCSGVWRLNKALLLISSFIWRPIQTRSTVYGAIQNSWHRQQHFDLIQTTQGLGGDFSVAKKSWDENIVSDSCTFAAAELE